MLVIPNRVDAATLAALENALGGRSKVAWMLEHDLRPSPELLTLLQRHEAGGFFISQRHLSQEALLARIRSKFAAGQHVVLLPGRPVQPPAAPADTTPDLLHYLLDEYPHPVLPVYAGRYNTKKPPFITTAEDEAYDKVVVSILPAVSPTPTTAAGVMAAWLAAAADQVGKLMENTTSASTLPHALLCSLLEHPGAKIIDGVDDSQMTYRQLLVRAATLARQLRRHVANKRIGIILPPGKYSIIANVACLLAGITPVNIDYEYGSAAFESVARQAELNRLITEHRFIQMQEDFPWPLTRDILFIDDIPDTSGFHLPLAWRLLHRLVTPARIASWIRTPEKLRPQDEALAIFSPASEGAAVQGAALSHQAVLAGAALCFSRFRIGAGKRVLSALPYHHRAGLLAGLIQPLLLGQDIITYPLPQAGKRLCCLARQYKPAMAVFTAGQAADVLAHAEEQDFAATTCFHVADRLHAEEVQRAYAEHGIYLCSCYLPPECAMPVACNTAPPAENPPHALPAASPGSMGLPLPGVAIRITDIDDPLHVLPLTEQGMVWVKGPGMFSQFAEEGEAPAVPAHERWCCTGDIGRLREDGLLEVHGPRARFSKIEGAIISHEAAERHISRLLQKPGEPLPAVAVLGARSADTGKEELVLLSTAHKVKGPHDVISLRYTITNAHLSALMAPAQIIPLRAIPTLPGGRVDYARCRSIYDYIQSRNN